MIREAPSAEQREIKVPSESFAGRHKRKTENPHGKGKKSTKKAKLEKNVENQPDAEQQTARVFLRQGISSRRVFLVLARINTIRGSKSFETERRESNEMVQREDRGIQNW